MELSKGIILFFLNANLFLLILFILFNIKNIKKIFKIIFKNINKF